MAIASSPSLLPAIASTPFLLPAIFRDVDTGTTLRSGSILVLPGQGFTDVIRELSSMAGGSDITVFLERSNKERVRMVAKSDLVRLRAVRLHVFVGLPKGACKECEYAINHCVAYEFHLCVEDKIISTNCLRSSVGPIQRPPRAMV